MACLIEPAEAALARVRFGVQSWITGGKRYRNSAARFWSGLVDEATRRFPGSEQFELYSAPAVALNASMLYPGQLDASPWATMTAKDLRHAIRDTMAELDLFGEPPVVSIRVLDAAAVPLAESHLSPESVDAEIFPFLAVWLLQWAGIPESGWNGEVVEGGLVAEALPGTRRFTLRFSLARQHVAEGLHRWILGMQYRVE